METYQEPNNEETKEDYFWILSNLLAEISEVNSVQYAEKILALEKPQEYFKGQILEAASKFDLVFLDIAVFSPLFRPDFLYLDKNDIFYILSKLLCPYHHNKEQGEQFSLGVIFEQFVDWFEDSDLSCMLLEEIFSLDKVSEAWHYSMMPSIFKLRDWITSYTKKKFEILKKGLGCSLYDIKIIFMKNIDQYIEKGLVDVNLNWIENN